MKKKLLLAVAVDGLKYFSRLLSVCLLFSSTSLYAVEEDPWESFNRKIFVFNDTVDKYFFKPVVQGYVWLAPELVERGVSNIFSNLGDVGVMVNNLCQAKPRDALTDAGRVLLNSSIGLAGFFDVATKMGLEKHEEDFGQTLGRWHVGAGPYIVLPLLGPSTVRDAFGLVPDTYLNPQNYIDHVPTRNSVYGVDMVDTRATLLDAEKLIQGDRYSFIRDVYLQRRDFLVHDGVIEDDFTSDDFE